MIAGSLDRIATVSARDHETGPGPVSDGETDVSRGGRVWQTSVVTSGRIIIGRRVGTLGLPTPAPGQRQPPGTPTRRPLAYSRGVFCFAPTKIQQTRTDTHRCSTTPFTSTTRRCGTALSKKG